MSMQTFAIALEAAEAPYREVIFRETYGHLAPDKNRTYRGHVTFAVGCFGSDNLNPTAMECEFGDLESSPWFFDAIQELLRSQEVEVGCVYRWDGSFRNYKFRGAIKKLTLS